MSIDSISKNFSTVATNKIERVNQNKQNDQFSDDVSSSPSNLKKDIFNNVKTLAYPPNFIQKNDNDKDDVPVKSQNSISQIDIKG